MDVPTLLKQAAEQTGTEGTIREWSVGAEFEWADEERTYNITCTAQRGHLDIHGSVRSNESGETVDTVERKHHETEAETRVVETLENVFTAVQRDD